MSYQAADFQKQLLLIGRKSRRYPRLITETQNIANALLVDTTTRDRTLQLHPLPVRIGRDKSPFTNTVLHLVNRGKGGNLANAAMASILNSSLALILPPTNTVAPQITYVSGGDGPGTQPGAQYAASAGTWNPTGTRANQWLRSGANITGATAASYTTVAADAGTNLSCRITMTNANGSTSVVSNSVAIA